MNRLPLKDHQPAFATTLYSGGVGFESQVVKFFTKLAYFDPATDELLVPTNVGTSTIHC